MASMRSRVNTAIGSARWVLDEREQASQFIEQEVEEFAISTRNDLEWLNEHMAEIFSSSQFDVAEVFKTPGKLRGKTPRTARKHTPGQSRPPLTDIFSSNTPNGAGSPMNDFYKRIAPIHVAEDKENAPEHLSPERQQKASPRRPLAEPGAPSRSPAKAATPHIPPRSPLRPTPSRMSPSPSRVALLRQQHESRSTGDSFVSAKEALSNREESVAEAEAPLEHDEPPADTIEETAPAPKAIVPEGLATRTSHQYSVATTVAAGMEQALEAAEQRSPPGHGEPPTPSEMSSPERPMIRKKSSLTFASLPAREPLSKKSIGPRLSRTRASEKGAGLRDSTWARSTQSHHQASDHEDENASEDESPGSDEKLTESVQAEPESSKLHSKTSTQRLHERITLLGKTNPPRPSKSIPSAFVAPALPQQPAAEQSDTQTTTADHEDDWIGPISQTRTTQSSQTLPGSFSTAASSQWNTQTQDTTLIDSAPASQFEETRDQPASSKILYPDLKSAVPTSTTPAGSPAVLRWNVDGPLSASKAKFNSFLKSAKGMFASSAATSAQAKLETLNSNASKSTVNLPATLLPEAQVSEPAEAPVAEEGPVETGDEEPISPPRRRSSRLLQEAKNKAEEVHNSPQKPTEESKELADPAEADGGAMSPEDELPDEPQSGPPQHQAQVTKTLAGPASQSGELRHPTKANKGNKVAKPTNGLSKGSMSIRVPSQKTMNNFNASLHSSAPETKAATSAASKAPTLTKKGSNSSLKSASASQAKSSAANNARLKALDAAAKSKEREEREKQRKADEKRERERKRADAEEEKRKRAEERKAAEQRREREEQEARLAAQKQRREREEQDRLHAQKQQAEAQRKNELLRRQAEAAKAAKAAKAAEAPQTEQQRPVSRDGENLGGSVRPHINPAKPKRYFQPDEDSGPSRPTTAHGSTYAAAQNGAKRRKTSDQGVPAPAQSTRPTMAPPVRPSMNRKQDVPNKFTHGFMASAASTQAGSSMLKTAISGSHHNNQPKTPHHMNDLAKFSSARIPFAEAPNPPAGQPSRSMQKTPGTAHKSSPQYPNGDNIELPEIATDSEDSDSDNEFVAPDWTNSPELRQLLERQQLLDPLKVFGPIAPLAMEEVFKGSKDRIAKFRARTSSANWSGPDRLTEEERRKDREARERFERDGGWTFRPNA